MGVPVLETRNFVQLKIVLQIAEHTSSTDTGKKIFITITETVSAMEAGKIPV